MRVQASLLHTHAEDVMIYRVVHLRLSMPDWRHVHHLPVEHSTPLLLYVRRFSPSFRASAQESNNNQTSEIWLRHESTTDGSYPWRSGSNEILLQQPSEHIGTQIVDLHKTTFPPGLIIIIQTKLLENPQLPSFWRRSAAALVVQYGPGTHPTWISMQAGRRNQD